MSSVQYPASGFVAPGFEPVLAVLSDSFARGIDKGCSFAAYYRGQPVVNIWGGAADKACRRPWKEDTMGFFHSTTKFVASVTIAHMIERGMLKYDDTIATHWPEFAQNGKENITLEMLLSYRAGLAVLSDNFDVGWMIHNPRLLHDMLARQKPLWTPDTAHGYHPITLGLYLNEIVKKVDIKGRSLSQYYQEEIAQQFGIDFFIGLPKPLQYRAARLEIIPLTPEIREQQMNTFKGNSTLLQKYLTQPKDWNATWFMFGHAGFGDQCCAADAHYQVGWAYVTNYLDASVSFTGRNKWRPLVASLFECVHKLENVQVDRKLLSTYEELEQLRLSQKQHSHL